MMNRFRTACFRELLRSGLLALNCDKARLGDLHFFFSADYVPDRYLGIDTNSYPTHLVVWQGKVAEHCYSADPRDPYMCKHYASIDAFVAAYLENFAFNKINSNMIIQPDIMRAYLKAFSQDEDSSTWVERVRKFTQTMEASEQKARSAAEQAVQAYMRGLRYRVLRCFV
ncbi:hypothetical protein V8J88_04675 [Massilia sp. W12]|uniref:hypothetical protein n=1 Tax=Massilia sp. W12 TaxID=3126507 RepID=UPI0030D09E57